MIRFCLTAAMLLIAATQAFAQDPPKEKFKIVIDGVTIEGEGPASAKKASELGEKELLLRKEAVLRDISRFGHAAVIVPPGLLVASPCGCCSTGGYCRSSCRPGHCACRPTVCPPGAIPTYIRFHSWITTTRFVDIWGREYYWCTIYRTWRY
jgi:hypothetical protein